MKPENLYIVRVAKPDAAALTKLAWVFPVKGRSKQMETWMLKQILWISILCMMIPSAQAKVVPITSSSGDIGMALVKYDLSNNDIVLSQYFPDKEEQEKHKVLYPESDNNSSIRVSQLNILDNTRKRNIPVAVYRSEIFSDKATAGIIKLPVVIINHGYTVKNTEYSFIANDLAAQGYVVISIQHDLPSDAPLPYTDPVYEQRKPIWERGVQNILCTIQCLKKTDPGLNLENFTLIGHSNGGDISMLFASIHQQFVSKVVSLDSLRMPFPKSNNLKILSLRGNDTRADTGVLPSLEEQEKFGIKIIQLNNIKHIDFCDRAPEKLKKERQEKIVKFITQ
jgi:dienelactone hydrolase